MAPTPTPQSSSSCSSSSHARNNQDKAKDEELMIRELSLVATVKLVPLGGLPSARGFPKTTPPSSVKALIKVKPSGSNGANGGGPCLEIASLKQALNLVKYPIFPIENIVQTRSKFMEQGLLTLETDTTAILLRDGKPPALTALVEAINKVKELIGSGKLGKRSESSISETEVTVTVKKEDTEETPPQKRPRFSPELGSLFNPLPKAPKEESLQPSKRARLSLSLPPLQPRPTPPSKIAQKEIKQLKKALASGGVNVNLKINSKAEYLKASFTHPPPTSVTIHGLGLKRIDGRILSLTCLVTLDLSYNSLGGHSNLSCLRNLECPGLTTLKLCHNELTSTSLSHPGLASAVWVKSLSLLDLSNNKIVLLPEWLVYLARLKSLDVSCNLLRVLPFNIHLLQALRTLNVSQNDLQFLPGPLAEQLVFLDKIDLSSNPGLSPDILKSDCGSVTNGSIVPSLLDLCAKAVLNPSYNTTWLSTPGSLPLPVMDHLFQAKRCSRCRSLVTRYIYHKSTYPVRFSAAHVIGSMNYARTQFIYCPQHTPVNIRCLFLAHLGTGFDVRIFY